MKFHQLGWIVTGALAGAMLAGGFQSKTSKYGVVDIVEVFSNSEFTKTQNNNLKTFGQTRQDMIAFAQLYPVFTPEQAQKYHDLSIKPQPTAAEKAELEKLKNEAIAQDKKFKDLQTKTSPTPEQVALLRDYNDRVQSLVKMLDRWTREFYTEGQAMQEKMRDETLERAKAAIREVGQKQGYSVVYMQDVVPYAANNITADSLKAMNSKR